jgi:hypothetical protein
LAPEVAENENFHGTIVEIFRLLKEMYFSVTIYN